MKKLAFVLLMVAALRVLQIITGLEIPLVKWLDTSSQAIGALIWSLLSTSLALVLPLFKTALSPETLKSGQAFWTGAFATWSAHLVCLLALLLGAWLLIQGDKIQWDPLTTKRWKRFRSLRRGHLSMWILLGLVFVALLDNVLVGKRALIVMQGGHLRCPFLEAKPIMGREFGFSPAESETDYRELKRQFAVFQGKPFE